MRLSLSSLLVILLSIFAWAREVPLEDTTSATHTRTGPACSRTISHSHKQSTASKATHARTGPACSRTISHSHKQFTASKATHARTGPACSHTTAHGRKPSTTPKATPGKSDPSTSTKNDKPVTLTASPDEVTGGTDATDDRVTPTGLGNDQSWVKNMTALGDSYTAAIGVGTEIDKEARRYSGSYASIVRELMANPVQNPHFQNIAYSGAVSHEIRMQIALLTDHSQDIVLVTAGGNDALLTELLKACVYLPTSVAFCKKAISNTKHVIDNDLEGDIGLMLLDLTPKMAKHGVVVYTLYAQFFNDKTSECDKKTQSLIESVTKNSDLYWSQGLRQELNQLVVDANKKIQLAIKNVQEKMNIAVAEWDEYAGFVQGRFCEVGRKDEYLAPENANILFNRLNFGGADLPYKKRGGDLAKRRRTKPNSHVTFTFHPNALGQATIAASVLEALDDFRQQLAGKDREAVCSDPKITNAKCLKRDRGIPQRESDGPTNLDQTVREWCRKNKGVKPKEKTGGADVDKRFATRYDYWYYSFWLSARDRQLPKCEQDTIEEDECVRLLLGGMAQCDPDSGASHGVEINSPCLTYSIDIGESLAENSPPWASAESDTCTKGDADTTITKDEFVKARDAWCKDPTKELPTPDQNKYLDFSFKGNDEKKCDITKDCVNTVNHLWLRCSSQPDDSKKNSKPGIDSKKGPLGGSGGTDGKCGHYSFDIKDKVPAAAKKISGSIGISWQSFPSNGLTGVNWGLFHFTGDEATGKNGKKRDYCKQGDPDELSDSDINFEDDESIGIGTVGLVDMNDFPPNFAFKDLKKDGQHMQDWPCTYASESSKPGTISCTGWKKITCKDEPDYRYEEDGKTKNHKVMCGGNYKRYPMALCTFNEEDKLF